MIYRSKSLVGGYKYCVVVIGGFVKDLCKVSSFDEIYEVVDVVIGV